MAGKKKVARKPKPVLIVKPPAAGGAERLEFARRIRQQLRASQSPPESNAEAP